MWFLLMMSGIKESKRFARLPANSLMWRSSWLSDFTVPPPVGYGQFLKERKMNEWKFNVGDNVALSMSGEKGVIMGRAEYSHAPQSYFVRYVAADGRQCEAWFDGDALRAN